MRDGAICPAFYLEGRVEQSKLDLHLHSCMSDGSCRPAEVVRLAKEAGVVMLALTDHDTLDGLAEAQEAAEESGLTFLPGVEIDTEFPETLHLLGLDFDPENAKLRETLQAVGDRRKERNEIMLQKLAALGCDVRPWLEVQEGTMTRLHIARALCTGGYAKDIKDAFRRYLAPGMPGYAAVRRLSPAEAIRLVLDAGGVPVVAHPCQLKCNVRRLIAELTEVGLMGVEAYYSSATQGQIAEHVSIARQNGLLVTCGSDFHGANRPGVVPGCAFRETETLETTRAFFLKRHQISV